MVRRVGTVQSFDAHAGLGTVAEGDGSSYTFHCTAISDGSRTIDEGTRVEFDLGAGGPGRWEAFAVTPLAIS